MKFILQNIETKRLVFTPVALAHFEEWLKFFEAPSSFEHWIAPLQSPREACRHWYERQQQRYRSNAGGMNALMERSTGKLVGHCGLLAQTVDGLPELEIGYSLLPDCRNKGFATEAAMKCRDIAFEKNFSDSLISIISFTNTPSANVAAKNGMKPEKQTNYKENRVNIFRIKKEDWKIQSQFLI